MAIQVLSEPYVKVRENIRDTPNLLDVNGSSNIGGVIVSPAGPRLAKVNGPDDFLSKYTKDGSIPRNAHISLVNAYYLSFATGLVISRSMNTQSTQGLIFSTGSKITYKVPITVDSNSLWAIVVGDTLYWYNGGNNSFDTFIETVRNSESANGGRNSAKAETYELFRSRNKEVTSLPDLATKIEESEKVLSADTTVVYSSLEGLVFIGRVISISQDSALNVRVSLPRKDLTVEEIPSQETPISVKVGDKILTLSTRSLNKEGQESDIKEYFQGSADLNYIAENFANYKDNVIPVQTVTELATNLKSVIPNVEVMGETGKLTIKNCPLGALSFTGFTPKITTQADQVLSALKVKFKDGVPLTKKVEMTVKLIDTDTWAFTFGSMAFYKGAIDKSAYVDYSLRSCESMHDVVTSINNLKGMSGELEVQESNTYKITVEYSEGNRLYVGNNPNLFIGVDTAELKKVNSESAEKTVVSNWNEKCAFGIYALDAQDSDVYRVLVSRDEGDLFRLALDDNQTNDTYSVSLLADTKDQSGTNAYIENLNSLGLKFRVFVNPEYVYKTGDSVTTLTGEAALKKVTPKVSQGFSFGNSGLNLQASASTTCMISALRDLEDQEMYDIEYLAPFGATDPLFVKNYMTIGKANDWFTPVDVPYTKTNPSSIKGYFTNIDQTSNAIALGPFDRNTALTGWMNYIAASTLYYSKVLNNKSIRKEFAPCFDVTNGVLDYTDPVYIFNKSDREKLLNLKCPVNMAVYDQRRSVYYLNDNRTHQVEINVASEEQNRRMLNKIKKDVKRLMGRFKGRFNTVSTRSDVVTLIESYFNQEIYSQIYHPERHEIICDESNNTENDIAANKLNLTVRVRLYNAIKFIDVLVDAFPLNVDFNS